MSNYDLQSKLNQLQGELRLNMFTLTKSLQEQAVDAHVEDYRGRRKVTHQVSIGEYSTEVNFKREDEEYSKVSAFFTQKRDGAVAEIKSWKLYLGFGIGAAAAIGAFFVGYWLFAVALIGISSCGACSNICNTG